MATPAQRFRELSPARRRFVHDTLAQYALGRWQAFAESRKGIVYYETVAGTRQVVDKRLPADALAAVRTGEGIDDVATRYQEPICALQDEDLSLPDTVEFAYYAIYNYFRRYALKTEIDDWILVNQALSSEADEWAWIPLLLRAIEGAIQQQ
jgi:hypothetical protein